MMRNVPSLILAAALFVSRCLPAQDTPVFVTPQPPPVAKKPLAQGSISGQVVCADTHTPARGARIIVMPADSFSQGEGPAINYGEPHMAIAALDGTFSVPHVPPGEYFVLAFAVGYLSPLDGITVPNDANPIERKAAEGHLREKALVVRINGQEAARADVELQRGAIVSGKVVYSDGSPASQLPVLLQNAEPVKREGKQEDGVDAGATLRMFFMRQSPNTDDQGHFRISGIPAGRYRLAVTQTFDPGLSLGEDLMGEFNPGFPKDAKLTIYSGNTLHRKAAKVYELRPGDTVDGIEITLPLTGLHSIQGTVIGKDGTPLNFGVLNLSDTADPTINFHANVQAGGEFRFSGVPEGIYEIKITRGLIFENPPTFEFPEEQMSAMLDQFKPIRAFADTKVAVTVQTTDIDDLAVTLADTKLPERTAPSADPDTAPDVVVVRPQ